MFKISNICRRGVKGEDDIVDKYSDYTCQTCGICLCSGSLCLRPQVLDAGLNRYDILNLYRFQTLWLDGVMLPRGIGKLKALHKLGFVDVSRCNGKAILEGFRELTQLRKLKMAGLRYRNSNKLWSAISGHNQLQSLSVEVEDLYKKSNHLDGCSCEGLLPPSCLERLTLVGKLFGVTEWIHKL